MSLKGPYLALCLSQKELDKILHKLGKSRGVFPVSGACVLTLENQSTGELVALVCVSKKAQKNNNPVELAGLLVHEAVHVWQAYARDIGEEKPGDEQEAYAIQAVSQELLDEYARRMNK